MIQTVDSQTGIEGTQILLGLCAPKNELASRACQSVQDPARPLLNESDRRSVSDILNQFTFAEEVVPEASVETERGDEPVELSRRGAS